LKSLLHASRTNSPVLAISIREPIVSSGGSIRADVEAGYSPTRALSSLLDLLLPGFVLFDEFLE
jgi:hypothetical protein